MTGVLFCEACGRPIEPGAALLVTERRSGRSYAICRPSIRGACLRSVGRRDRTALAEWDPAAAIEYDHREALEVTP